MRHSLLPGRINVKALVILGLVFILLGGAFVGGYKIRKRVVANRALAAGQAAFDRRDWPEACKQLKVYVSRYADENPEVLGRYARANLAVRPRTQANTLAAIAAYRRLMRLRPDDAQVCHELAGLYIRVRVFSEAAYVCRQRLDAAPDDQEARLLLAKALIGYRKLPDAARELKIVVQKEPATPEAYVLLAGIAQADESPPVQKDILEVLAIGAGVASSKPADLSEQLLTLGIQRNPASLLPLVRRAQFMRLVRGNAAAARKDLEAVDALKPSDPDLVLLLFEEWLEQPGDGVARAEAELRLLEGLDEATLASHDKDKRELALPRLLAAVSLARRKGDPKQTVVTVDQALAELTGDDRLVFLPTAVRAYLLGGLLDEARQMVDEYRRGVNEKIEPGEALQDDVVMVEAGLAEAEGKPDAVIDLLSPFVAAKPDKKAAWLMLIQAYRQTARRQQMLYALETSAGRWPKDPNLASQLADAYQAEGRWSEALKYATLAEQSSPADLGKSLARIRLSVNVWLARGADQEVGSHLLRELTVLRQQYPRSVDVRLLQATIGARQGYLDNVIADLETALKECDRPFAAELMLAQCYERKNLADKAAALMKGAIQRQGDVAMPRMALAELYVRLGRKDEARSVLEEACSALAGEERVLAAKALAQFLLSQGQRPKGIELLQQLATERPKDLDLRMSLLRIPEVLSDSKLSQGLIDELKAIGGDRPFRWHLEQARLLLHTTSQGTPDEARSKTAAQEAEIAEHLNACIAADPAWAQPVMMLGAMQELIGKDDLAEQTYRQYLQAQTAQAEVAERLVRLLLRQRRYVPAAEILRQVPEQMRALPDMRRQAVSVAIGAGDTDSAIRDVEVLVAADPKDAASRVVLARLVYGAGQDVNRAMQLLDEAQSIEPDSFGAVSARAEILHAEGRDKEALEVMNAAVDRRKDFASYLLRAQFHQAMKQYDLAEADYAHLTQMEDAVAAGYELLGRFHDSRGDSAKAIATWETGLKKAPDAVGLQKRLVKELLDSQEAGMRSRGRAMLEDLLAQTPDDADLLALHNGLLSTDTKPADMGERLGKEETLLEHAAGLNPGNVDAHLRLVELARARWDPAKAQERLDRALEANPGNPRLLLMRAEVEAEAGNDLVARALARAVLSRDAKNLAACGLLTTLAVKAGEFDVAMPLNDDALKVAPGHEMLHVVRAEILTASGRRNEAIEHLDAFCRSEEGRGSAAARLMLADLHRANGDLPAAAACIDSAESMARGNPAVFAARVNLLAARKEFDAVPRLLADYRSENPDRPAALLVAASALVNSGDQQAVLTARKVADELVAAFPNYTEGHIARAEAARQAGDLEAAAAAYHDVLKLEPFHQRASNDLAWLLGEQLGRPQEALEIADKAAARYLNDPHLLDTRGAILMRLGRWTDARRDLERCLDLAKGLPSTQAHAAIRLARVLRELKEAQAAKVRLEQALRIDQEHRVLTEAERSEAAKLIGS